ncbi:hypothetical protein [Spartinivicinus poritis]|uniref:Uncharacterized protein n=1 Tax=Spartinivicinus poritis TaxID=2994640 RepID=A0ABT5UHF6_9GAMM|nr:hypothetical protein [Spartinivicinus sp. A2-2]MDE1465421.1 hypothetical protein [Spartinivicinus sp. A2-2]
MTQQIYKTQVFFDENGAQCVNLPDEFKFSEDKVLIKKVGDSIVLRPFPESVAEKTKEQDPNKRVEFASRKSLDANINNKYKQDTY